MSNALPIGGRLEPLVDDYLIASADRCELTLHPPQAQEVAIAHTEPWEGNTSFYHTIFRDGDILRMYYRGSHYDESSGELTPTHEVTCYAESRDGITWEKPALGLREFDGSKQNNIILAGEAGSHDFVPFKDENPACPPEERYKAVARKRKAGLLYFVSADAVTWTLKQPDPIITKGAFDSQNLAFWDPLKGKYVDYHRDFRDGVRDIVTCESDDFLTWTDPEWITYPGAPDEHLYTNQIAPYYRAPHIYFGFPKRFVPDRNVSGHPAKGVSDAVFMSSRDGRAFRRWQEAYIRPGLQESRWVNRNNFIAWGLVETDSKLDGGGREISLYSAEAYYRGDGTRMRRFTTRLDGFVSMHAPPAGGEFVTKPITFDGSSLHINFSTSAPGSVELEVLSEDEKRIDGFTFEDFGVIYGDSVDCTFDPPNRSFRELAGTPVRLRFRMADADLYSVRFA